MKVTRTNGIRDLIRSFHFQFLEMHIDLFEIEVNIFFCGELAPQQPDFSFSDHCRV
jgi:hypothetical protein